MRVLSLFDGMGCGQIALKELGVNVSEYYSSEIDKHAIKQIEHNFPDTIHLGDVANIKPESLPKIDLLIGGSPCQGFSFAGKQLNFNDPRSELFFKYVDILKGLKKINPDIKFMLENVNMKMKHLSVITEHLGIMPTRIDSNLVSAQNRDRWYWSNIKTELVGLFNDLQTCQELPEDRGILLKDIKQPESEIDDKYILSDKLHSSFLNKKGDFGQRFKPQIEKINPKAACLLASGAAWKITGDYIKLDRKGNKKGSQNKASCLTGGGNSGGNHSDMDILCVAMRGRNPDNSSDRTPGAPTEQRLEAKTDGKTNCLTTVQKDNLVIAQYQLRRLTPTECARLQTIPEWYEWIVSNTQQYKMLGNGWTIEVIKHLFKDLQQFEHLT